MMMQQGPVGELKGRYVRQPGWVLVAGCRTKALRCCLLFARLPARPDASSACSQVELEVRRRSVCQTEGG